MLTELYCWGLLLTYFMHSQASQVLTCIFVRSSSIIYFSSWQTEQETIKSELSARPDPHMGSVGVILVNGCWCRWCNHRTRTTVVAMSSKPNPMMSLKGHDSLRRKLESCFSVLLLWNQRDGALTIYLRYKALLATCRSLVTFIWSADELNRLYGLFT